MTGSLHAVKSPPAETAPCIDAVAAAAIRQLRAGEPFVLLCHNDVDARAAALATVIARLDGATKLVWTGNPLRSPFTIERLMLQAAGAESDFRLERTPAELAGMLSGGGGDQPGGPAPSTLIVVQQPETIDPATRDTLAAMRPHLETGSRHVQFLFCGTTAFAPIGGADKQRVQMPPPPPSLRRDTSDKPRPRQNRARIWSLLMLLAVAGTVVVAVNLPPVASTDPQHPIAANPRAANAAPMSIEALPTASVPDRSAASVDPQALRREFDRFLESQPSRFARLTTAERDQLFQEYLQRTRTSGRQAPL